MKRFGQEHLYKGFVSGDEKKLLGDETPFAIREAYNSIRTKLLFYGQGERCPVFAVTSSVPGDGKTMSAANLAISFAQLGQKTLLVDGDLRKPTMHKYFCMNPKDGLSEFLAGLSKLVNIRKTERENLYILTAGDIPPNPAELLASSKMESLMEEFRERFDCVIIDTPPIEVVADAALLAQYMTGYIFIVKCGNSDIYVTRRSIETLQELGGRVVGFILNDSQNISSHYYKSGKHDKKYYIKPYKDKCWTSNYRYDYDDKLEVK